MKKNKTNLLIGTLLTLCILIPLFYFTISNKKINLNEPKIGNINNTTDNKKIANENPIINDNANVVNYGNDGTKSSGIRHIKVPNVFSKSFYFRNPSVYYSYIQRPDTTSTEAPVPGTIQSPTNNLKPIPKPNTTRRISPNVVQVPKSHEKNNKNLPKPTPVENITPNINQPIIPNVPKENIKPQETTPAPVPDNKIEIQQPEPVIETAPPSSEKQVPIEPKVDKSSKTPSSHDNIASLNDVEQAIFNQVNIERSKVGLPLLSYNKTMEKYARIKSKDMGDKNYFSHEDLQGNLITVQMAKDGVKYKAWGENIASRGGGIDFKKLSDQFMTQWMNSAGHRANILSTDFQSMGVGLYQIGNEVFATQEFYK
ncbi:CAP domain-containing protein [Clostridium tarantellae]|uniref:SCP domain-containing protein n=1 Tax=Clostridium tarantellae TaxID=39493 RepID=A0A6I1MSB4_9CLOT|nr:CAP domain-containing protein [Clostridium tarantellae]MPQ43781.1 hypothetical protein [Clostridium tarantellae]